VVGSLRGEREIGVLLDMDVVVGPTGVRGQMECEGVGFVLSWKGI
jgi:hypothetical protein